MMDLTERRKAYDKMIGLLEAEMAVAPTSTYAGVVYANVAYMKKCRDMEPAAARKDEVE